MKAAIVSVLGILYLLVVGCEKNSVEPAPPTGAVGAYVYFGTGLPGKTVVLVEKQDTLITGTDGRAVFHVPPGHYTIRAIGITRGGPAGGAVSPSVDFPADVRAGDTTWVDIFDCVGCI